MGVNLPAHLVIIKNTQQYVNGAYQVSRHDCHKLIIKKKPTRTRSKLTHESFRSAVGK